MADIVLEVKNLHTTFFSDSGTVPAVDGVDFVLERGHTLGIVGESGTGSRRARSFSTERTSPNTAKNSAASFAAPRSP